MSAPAEERAGEPGLSGSELRDAWPVLALEERLEGLPSCRAPRPRSSSSAARPRPGRPAPRGADRHPALADAPPAARRRRRRRAGSVGRGAPRLARAARRADAQGGQRAAGLRRGRRRRPDEPALRAPAPGHDRRRGDQLPAPPGAAARRDDLLRSTSSTPQQHLLGVVSFRDLFAAEPNKRVRDDHGDRRRHGVRTTWTRRPSRECSPSTTSLAIPVVDADGAMKGIVTVDDIVDVVQEEATEDIQKFGGMEALDVPYLQSSWFGAMIKQARRLARDPLHRRDAHGDRDRLSSRTRSPTRGRARAVRAAHHLERRQLRLAGLDARHPRDGARRGPLRDWCARHPARAHGRARRSA